MMNHPKFWFEQISQIPRGSLNEKEIAGFLVEFANKIGRASWWVRV